MKVIRTEKRERDGENKTQARESAKVSDCQVKSHRWTCNQKCPEYKQLENNWNIYMFVWKVNSK